ncbi:MAG: 50S ribosomal protein L30 [Chloroflexi bacterium]|nr:50S ribosomal protein L30 [Chloroflexota bacterium]
MSNQAQADGKRIRVTWKKSANGYNVRQKRTLRALGLKSLNQTVEHKADPAVLGMVKAVSHLVEVEEVF